MRSDGLMKKLLLLGLALLAVYMAQRAVRRQAEVLQLAWALLGLTALTSTANTPKTRSTEDRLNNLIPVVFPNTGGTISGSVNVTGNHSVGGSLTGPGGTGTLTVGSPAHVSGAGMTVDNGITSHAGVVADGNISAGGTGSFASDVEVGGNLRSSGGTLNVAAAVAMTGGFTANGGSTVHGNFAIDNALHVSGIQIDPTQVTEGTAGSCPNPPTQAYVQGLTNRVNQLLASMGQ